MEPMFARAKLRNRKLEHHDNPLPSPTSLAALKRRPTLDCCLSDHDWVVTGATQNTLEQKGYQTGWQTSSPSSYTLEANERIRPCSQKKKRPGEGLPLVFICETLAPEHSLRRRFRTSRPDHQMQ